MPMNARRLLAPAPYRARVTPPSSPGPRPGRSGRLPWALAALAAWVSLAACSDDPSAAGPDSAAPDATAPDTVDAAEGPDSAAPDVADDVAAPDVLPADTADVPEPADTAPPADATEPPDALVPPDFPLTCTVHADCLTPCAAGRCSGDRCVFDAPQSGCVLPDATGARGTCALPGAVDPATACLVCNPAFAPHGYTGVLWHADFDGDDAAMSVEKLADSTATWTVTARRAASGTASLYFGDPSAVTYGVGTRAAARAVSPPLTGPTGVPWVLTFDLWLDTEETPAFDYLRVLADDGGGQPVELWHSDLIGGTTFGESLPITVALGARSAAGVRLVFEFDSVDGIINDFEGAYLDAVRVATGCCDGADDCADADPCTSDRCGEDGRCAFAPVAGCCLLDRDCDDGDACTRDSCSGAGGTCTVTPVFDCCHAKSDCDDGDPCTEDLCPGDGELCEHQALCCAADADCVDDDPCTQGRCVGSACVYVTSCCAAADDCDDGDACTADSCVAGTCRHEFAAGPGCCRPDVLTQRFDAGPLTGWTLSAATASVGWRLLATDEAQSGTSVLYYGHPTLHYYDSGGSNKGTATSATVRIPDGVEVRLSFRVRLDVEASPAKDVFKVEALVGAAVVELVGKSDLAPGAEWQAVSVDVSWLAGQNVRVRFSFDTVDALANTTTGVLIDDLRLLSSCAPRPCQTEVSCPSPVSCIDGACAAGGCSYGGDC